MQTKLKISQVAGYKECQGRLTLESGVPVSTTDQTAKTTLYFTPYKGNIISLYNTTSTKWDNYEFTEISASIPSTTDTNYDVFIYDNSGTLTLELIAWTDSTTRATVLATQDGIYVQTGSTNKLFTGSIRTTSTSGQCEDSMTQKRFVSNYYNRIPRPVRKQESTAIWTYNSTTWRPSNNSILNRIEILICIKEIKTEVNMIGSMIITPAGIYGFLGIGVDSTTVSSDQEGMAFGGVATSQGGSVRKYIDNVDGYHYYQALESTLNGTVSFTGVNTLGRNGTTVSCIIDC